MKKLQILTVYIFIFSGVFSQHFSPLKLSINPDAFNMATYGSLSFDKGNGNSFTENLSNTTQTGFVVNALYKKRGQKYNYHQFIIDFNPIIINWDPFTWNKFTGQLVDSFAVYKMPFAEDALLHVGWHINSLKRIRGTQISTEYRLLNYFTELYFTPYSLYSITNGDTVNYKFSCFNLSTGFQYAYVKKEVPILGSFLIGLSPQFNLMFVNEQDKYLNGFKNLTNHTDNIFYGFGAKLSIQTNYLNIYIEGKQFYGTNTNNKFTKQPTVLVGASTNMQWTSKKNNDADGEEGGFY